eukprot:jgi/Tetstr1/453960/TSEL_040879.t1
MFNRLRYDSCATKAEIRDNVSIFSHTVDINRFTHTDPCAHDRGLVAGNTTSTVGPQPQPDAVHQAWGDMIALENDLRGQTRTATRCPSYDYIPKKGVVSSPSMYRPPQPDIGTASKDTLPACQMIDYRNVEREAYAGVAGTTDGTGAGSGR